GRAGSASPASPVPLPRGAIGAGAPFAYQGRVLMAEDNPVNREVAIGRLEALGLEVRVAADGREAVSALGEEDFDLVLMDCQMPVMDGFEATAEIRGREQGSHAGRRIPIIALTANA